MLMTKLKAKDVIASLGSGKVFIINCHGCREVGFPDEAAHEVQRGLMDANRVTGVFTTDYICDGVNLGARIKGRLAELEAADTVLVFSCGVGVQTVAYMFEDKRVCACCDTVRLPGGQGVTPMEVDCAQCGECFLNMTGGICPITACSKSLVNGPCGGTKDGMCEVDPTMECGWARIYKRLENLGRLDALRCPTRFRNFATDEATKDKRDA